MFIDMGFALKIVSNFERNRFHAEREIGTIVGLI